ncbi:sigma-54 dependent transcriptional regulator [Myxococcota bacterium]|nr:sigma-54 dependent transcriptional regulator [Myxococcota bacterium]
MSRRTVLIVDDDRTQAEALADLLHGDDLKVDVAFTLEGAADRLARLPYHVVFSDLHLPGGSGLDLARSIRARSPATVVIMFTGERSVDTAFRASTYGVAAYLQKPVDPDRVRGLVQHYLTRLPEVMPRSQDGGEVQNFQGMVSQSRVMERVFQQIQLCGRTGTTVLIRGESGTGKELVAQAIHACSPRGQGPFVPVHTGALPRELVASELFGHERGAFTGAVAPHRGKFEEAEGGTIFLDEVNTMDERTQISLLRVLETFRFTRVGGKGEQKADVRVVAASNRDLLALVSDGAFREDLYYRLAVITIDLPPLRERREDVVPLAYHFLKETCSRHERAVVTMDPKFRQALTEFDWPGNVRQLRNVIENAVVLCVGDHLTADLLPGMVYRRAAEARPVAAPLLPVDATLGDLERMAVRAALDSTNWNKNQAAKRLGISRRALYNKIARFGISRP